jgi:hypothetical protein
MAVARSLVIWIASIHGRDKLSEDGVLRDVDLPLMSAFAIGAMAVAVELVSSPFGSIGNETSTISTCQPEALKDSPNAGWWWHVPLS